MYRFMRGMKTTGELRSNSPLVNEAIIKAAPSIFAAEAHPSRSARYSYIPTSQVLDGLRKEGFFPFSVTEAKARREDKHGYTKHLVRLRHARHQHQEQDAFEIILVNSHDGTSSYQMLAGYFRFVCCNGLVMGDTVSDVRIRHSGNVVNNVIEGAVRVLDDFEFVNEQRETMKAITLNEPERIAFAESALQLKYDEDDGPAPITESQILSYRRRDDDKKDLWTTFNVVQENLIKGGLHGRNKLGRPTTTRPVKAIDTNIKLNRALWTLAERMKQLKNA